MNDNTRIRIRVPAHLYESVKKQLTLKEGKQNFGAGFTTVKEKKNPSTPKSSSMPKSEGSKMTSKSEGKQEKSVEERMASLEEMVKQIMDAVKPKGKQTLSAGFADEAKEEEDESRALVNEKGKKKKKDESRAVVNEDDDEQIETDED